MKKLNNAKWFTIGVAVCFLFTMVVVPAVAQAIRQAELNFNNIRITLNGEELTPTDVHGNIVEPFIIDGTTYLPVRALANALELDVDWDEYTNTILLTTPPPSIIGQWRWTTPPQYLSAPDYVFNPDGTGYWFGDINWWTNNGVLYICITPNICGDNCILPYESYYMFEGDQLILKSRWTPDIYDFFTRP